MADVAIKEYRPAESEQELEKLLEAYLAIFNEADNLGSLSLTGLPFQEDSVRKSFLESQQTGSRYFAVVDGDEEILAVLVTKADPVRGFELVAAAVSPEVRYQGFGRLLIDRGLTAAAEEGYGAVDALVFADNDSMLRLMVGMGFRPVRMTHHVRADGGDIVHLRRYLRDT